MLHENLQHAVEHVIAVAKAHGVGPELPSIPYTVEWMEPVAEGRWEISRPWLASVVAKSILAVPASDAWSSTTSVQFEIFSVAEKLFWKIKLPTTGFKPPGSC